MDAPSAFVPPPPRHVAIIMDGNGRWAKARGLPRTMGHRRGVEAVRRTCEAARDIGVKCLTLFSFSSENWRRPPDEIADLMQLLRLYLRSEIAELHRNNTRLRVIGDRSRLSDDIVQLVGHAEEVTRANTAMDLVIALSYGGRAEIAAAARRLAEEAAAGRLDPAAVDEDRFAATLFTAGLPDPDLLVRTAGERRLSNFLLWQLSYAEIHVTEVLWPEFRAAELQAAFADFAARHRTYGGLARGV
jgi:undecaprenyl diphosphate synthase